MTPSITLLVTLLLLIAYVALLVWALRRQKQIVQGRWLFFLRAFFPNWKFYHAVGRPPRLYVRGQAESGEWGIWQQVYPRRARKLWHLVHNADVNLALSHQNLVDHLAADINDLPEDADVRDCVSYQLVARLAQAALPATAYAYQFELRLESPQGEEALCMLKSPVLTA